jgi:hypothetical protein
MTRSGSRVSAALASAGTEAEPSGLPGLGSDRGRFAGLGDLLALGRELGIGSPVAAVDADVEAVGAVGAGATKVGGGGSAAQPDSAKAQVTVSVIASGERTARW